jgi:hypothetical protein
VHPLDQLQDTDCRDYKEDHHGSNSSSEANQVDHAKKLVETELSQNTKHEKSAARARRVEDQVPISQFPSADDKRTMNEILRQWLANFNPFTYRDIMTIHLNSEHRKAVSVHALGGFRSDERFYAIFGLAKEIHKELGFWRRLLQDFGYSSIRGVYYNVGGDILHVMDAICVPYVEYSDRILCFYPEGILPVYDKRGTFKTQCIRSFELLKTMRFQVLQWWQNLLAAPQHTWAKRPREIKMLMVEMVVLAPKKYTLKTEEIRPSLKSEGMGSGPKPEPKVHSDVHWHINAALHHSCCLCLKLHAKTTISSRARANRKLWTY